MNEAAKSVAYPPFYMEDDDVYYHGGRWAVREGGGERRGIGVGKGESGANRPVKE